MPAAKKWPAELTLCTQKISLLRTLILPTTNECIKHNTTDVSSPFTWANIDEIVCSYYNHLNIAPTIKSSTAEVFANSPLIPSSDSCYKFFMDGSLINLGTPEVSMGWFWAFPTLLLLMHMALYVTTLLLLVLKLLLFMLL
ncbi:unnamed protein product [Rhizophagus irregularis]|nr:unnamed protein product [Rhizophagus irregularis]